MKTAHDDMHGDALAQQAGDCPVPGPMRWAPMTAHDEEYEATTDAPGARICCDGRCSQGRHCPLDGPPPHAAAMPGSHRRSASGREFGQGARMVDAVALARQRLIDANYRAHLDADDAQHDGFWLLIGGALCGAGVGVLVTVLVFWLRGAS